MADEIKIECPDCGESVSAEAANCLLMGEEWNETGFFLVQCPSCKRPLFGRADRVVDNLIAGHWNSAERLWPACQAQAQAAAQASPI